MAVWTKRLSGDLSRLAMLLLLSPTLMCAPAAGGKIHNDVVFSHYGSAASNPELARRLLSPATLAQIERQLTASGRTLEGQAINLAAERYIIYVPSQAPPQGYALLVFVPPWQQAGIPQGWAPVLDRYGVIFVSAARSGNDENTMGRREPLALLAALNVMADYRVDPQHVYIGGFSGGSRVAERLAVGYPDLFHGAILNAGSSSLGDPSAEPPIPLPSRDLFYQLQTGTHLIYVTGARDTSRVDEDMLSARSMREWCVFNVESIVEPLLDHTVARPDALSRALGSLAGGIPEDADRLARCRSAADAEINRQFGKVDSLIASGKRAAADKLLERIDQHYGGLAAPQSLELMNK